MNWENYRMSDGTFDMYRAYIDVFGAGPSMVADAYVGKINELQPIKSRQLAAILLVNMWERRNAF